MITEIEVGDVVALAGAELGPSSWHEVTRARIDAFAAATHDWAPIHVDPGHAASTPLGVTVAHGLYMLALGPKFFYEIMAISGHSWGLKYGYDKVRFTAPVLVGSRLRMRLWVLAADRLADGWRLRFAEIFELEGSGKPACVAETIGRYFTG
jgi:acyl dehydratase